MGGSLLADVYYPELAATSNAPHDRAMKLFIDVGS